jgi:hypothetical protein
MEIDYENLGELIEEDYKFYCINQNGRVHFFETIPEITQTFWENLSGCGIALYGMKIKNKPKNWKQSLRKVVTYTQPNEETPWGTICEVRDFRENTWSRAVLFYKSCVDPLEFYFVRDGYSRVEEGSALNIRIPKT